MVKVYQYGLLPPTENASIVWEQLREANRLRNCRTEYERGRRQAMRQHMSASGDIGSLEEAVLDAATPEAKTAAIALLRDATSATDRQACYRGAGTVPNVPTVTVYACERAGWLVKIVGSALPHHSCPRRITVEGLDALKPEGN